MKKPDPNKIVQAKIYARTRSDLRNLKAATGREMMHLLHEAVTDLKRKLNGK